MPSASVGPPKGGSGQSGTLDHAEESLLHAQKMMTSSADKSQEGRTPSFGRAQRKLGVLSLTSVGFPDWDQGPNAILLAIFSSSAGW